MTRSDRRFGRLGRSRVARSPRRSRALIIEAFEPRTLMASGFNIDPTIADKVGNHLAALYADYMNQAPGVASAALQELSAQADATPLELIARACYEL